MAKFNLGLFCLGNGLTCCNRAVYENGDYKVVAHISPAGNITWRVRPETIPGPALLRIEHSANTMRANFSAELQRLITADPWRAYERMLDALPTAEYLEFTASTRGKQLPPHELCAMLTDQYLARC